MQYEKKRGKAKCQMMSKVAIVLELLQRTGYNLDIQIRKLCVCYFLAST